YTVNTQLVNATLMNIADNPTNVQLPGSYDETPLNRVPIIVTGNDFSTLYAPLIRDGRMEKFYWEPNREERIDIVAGIFESKELSSGDIEILIDEFPNQAIDFFSALRSRLYDEQISLFIQKIGIEKVSKRLVNSAETPPEFTKPNFSLSHLREVGLAMVAEQNRIRELRLVEEYHQSRLFGKLPKAETIMMPKQQLNKDNSYVKNSLPVGSGKLSDDALQQIKQILASGYRVGLEYADRRRFKTGSWKSAFTLDTAEEKEAIAAIENCLAERENDYIRLIGIDPKVKRRIVETIIHQP
ncbi:MAG: ribulose 1,5-bisphosphate carboxylase, partial [Okeania sp. SIO2H7]|nr:ribulose 1,5-bisphosphate carboxylase [Okeania sp. SIO2H7]